MKIESSAVSMASYRQYTGYSEASTQTTLTPVLTVAPITANPNQSKGDIAEFSTKLKSDTSTVDENGSDIKSIDEYKLEIVMKMLNALKHKKSSEGECVSCKMKDIMSDDDNARSSFEGKLAAISASSASVVVDISKISAPVATQWRRTTVSSAFFAEMENTSYEATGVARTADGREISFGVSIEMTRAFCEQFKSVTIQENVSTDPLVINLDANYATISDQKFLFDLNSDGQQELISFTENGSGFLALDKNGDGIVNNGSELFGPGSGNGFTDLAKYDSDGNNWIDEADTIFKDLKIWTKDDGGNNVLLSLKEQDIGAIYLGNAPTEFSLNNSDTNQSNGVIRSTGIYLKESGNVGTIQHVDLTM